VIKFL